MRTAAGPRWLPAVGAAMALLTMACCIGVPAVVALVSAAGAGFLLTDRNLQPALIVLLGITVAASAISAWTRRRPVPLVLTAAAAMTIYWFIYRDYRVPAVWIGAAALVAAQVWSLLGRSG